MDPRNLKTLLGALLAAAGLNLFAPAIASAHCDGVDGPVVAAARRALEARNPAFVLIWVQPADEAEIKTAFERTLAVRALGPEARDLADRFFFETLVRVHRAGEGAPYTGLKPAGRDLGAAIPAADRAVETGSLDPLAKLLSESVGEHLREQFHRVESAKRFAATDIHAGREYVKAYVEFIHYVERVYEASAASPHGHGPK
jgi:hypothetical protein